jgi:hypothetical protein
MPERTVKLGSMFYIDEDGRGRRADEGAKIQVSSDFVKKFDELNHLAEPAEGLNIVPPVAPEAVEAAEREVPKQGRRKADSE